MQKNNHAAADDTPMAIRLLRAHLLQQQIDVVDDTVRTEEGII